MRSVHKKCLLVALVSCLFPQVEALATNAPSNLVTTAVSSSQVNLTWTDNSTDEIGFTFAFDTNSGLTNPTYTFAGGVNTTSYSHTGRSPATTYFYQIKAEGNPDSTWTAVKSATTPPASLAASVVSNSQINLSWTGNAGNSNIVGYTVASATNSSFTGAVYQFVTGGTGATSFNHTGLTANTTYYYKIKAEGTSDTYDSPFTAPISATTSVASGSSGIPISAHFAGINAWMPYQIGSHVYNGKLETKWAEVQASGAKIMRYGGNGVDHYADPSDPSQYVTLVDSMRSRGIEPVLQVPVYGSTFNSTQAADIVRYVNVTNAKAVKYWVIGNEPDLSGGGYGTGYSASQAAAYFRSFASAMKAVDPTIKIIGPETAWYDTAIIDGLTSCTGNSTTDANSIMGKDGSGNYYVDIVSFHTYPFDGTQTRPQVISKLMATGGFNDNLGALKTRLATCNSLHGRTGGNVLKMAVTEANINYSNPAGDGAAGLGAKSFIGGQFWAELMGIAMQRGVDFVTFWSVIEGNGLSYLSSDGTTKWPSYYHFQMMSQNFRGSSVTATDNQANVKAFGAEDTDQIVVMIMNQETASSFTYTVRLDTGTVTGANPLKINVDAGVAVEYDDTLAAESSVVLVFDASGTLKKKIEYTRSGHAASNLPPTVTTY
ncbi:MAG: hypothetical protein QOF89_5845 [Acidobacteriota bacterium]|jgi:chitodextrinase|nr:hypothetical protein [Acidobacteriota bacterium]